MAERRVVLENPSLKASVSVIKKAIEKHLFILIIGNCRVDYQGRARSTLELGERTIIIKEDGATLIHRPGGYEPVNWQPSGCYLRTTLAGKTLVLNVIRRNPPESLKIYIHQIYVLIAIKIVDYGKFYLHVSEKEMQKAILAEPEILEEGFKPIAYEKRVDPGFLDIYGLDSSGRLVVVEIKRIKAGKSAVLQLARYVEDQRKTTNKDIRGILAAPDISKGVQRLLATLNLEYKRIDLIKCAQVVKKDKTRTIQDFLT